MSESRASNQHCVVLLMRGIRGTQYLIPTITFYGQAADVRDGPPFGGPYPRMRSARLNKIGECTTAMPINPDRADSLTCALLIRGVSRDTMSRVYMCLKVHYFQHLACPCQLPTRACYRCADDGVRSLADKVPNRVGMATGRPLRKLHPVKGKGRTIWRD